MGNELRGDDAFGVAMAKILADRDMGDEVTVKEYGIGGIHMVQDLMTGYDALLVIDAVRRGSEAGTIHLLEPEVPDLDDMPLHRKRDYLADMHWAEPARAMVLAKALGVLPARVLVLGCQPQDVEELTLTLTHRVNEALPRALQVLDQALARLRSPVPLPQGVG
ncbi:MAG: HyaD/HybD family hydrogenase maturation endopeptidase [Candidatus Dormibacteria bacterium]